MSNCKFSITPHEPISTLLPKITKTIISKGGTMEGNENQGKYLIRIPFGKLEGTYTVSEQTITFHITHKPFLISCKDIESYIKKYMATAPPPTDATV